MYFHMINGWMHGFGARRVIELGGSQHSKANCTECIAGIIILEVCKDPEHTLDQVMPRWQWEQFKAVFILIQQYWGDQQGLRVKFCIKGIILSISLHFSGNLLRIFGGTFTPNSSIINIDFKFMYICYLLCSILRYYCQACIYILCQNNIKNNQL